MSLNEDYNKIRYRTEDYRKSCEYWWRYNSHWANGFFATNLACSLGATIAGLLKMPLAAGIFGAVMTTIIAVQKSKAFESEVAWYAAALARCNVLINRLTSPFSSVEELKKIEIELNDVMAGEGTKAQQRVAANRRQSSHD